MSWFEWYQGEMMKSVGQKWQNPILSLLHFLYKYYVTFLTFMMFQNLSGVNEFDVCWKIWLICKYYVTFFTFWVKMANFSPFLNIFIGDLVKRAHFSPFWIYSFASISEFGQFTQKFYSISKKPFSTIYFRHLVSL